VENVPVTMDSKGRVRVSKEQRRAILEKFERSGVSAVQFAELSGLKYSTLAGWLQRYRRRPRRGPTRRVHLLEAVVEHGSSADSVQPSVVLCLAGGAQMELSDEKQIPLAAGLIRALARPC
jgi:transposase-like protein